MWFIIELFAKIFCLLFISLCKYWRRKTLMCQKYSVIVLVDQVWIGFSYEKHLNLELSVLALFLNKM